MTPEVTYFLKVNAGVIIFYAFYRLFFYKDTFFHWRRTALVSFLGLSILYPLLNIEEWIKGQDAMVALTNVYATVVMPEIQVQATSVSNWETYLTSFLTYLYISGIIVLTCRFLVQLSCILLLHRRCRKTEINGIKVHLLQKETGPFSFFNWIFIYPESETEDDLKEILTHELTHAQQLHSLDVIFSELVCIVCWINPFIWLMKREIRNNLEYMADHQVVQSGYDPQKYQYHLLGLTHKKAAAKLSNTFNVLPLKNRIKMMNQKRTKRIGRTKYILFLPLAALLMLVSNIETVARTTKEIAKDYLQPKVLNIPQSTDVNQPTDQVMPIDNVVPTPPQDKKKVPQTTKDNKQKEVFVVVEDMPSYPGGMKEMMSFLSKNVKYPADAVAKKAEGRVIAQFVVGKDGSISDIKIVRNAPLVSMDNEAIRVIKLMPKWTPGTQRGEAVSVKYTIPINFAIPQAPPAPPMPPKATNASSTEVKKMSEVVVTGYGDKSASNNENIIMDKVDQMPKFPGGNQAMMKYLAQSLKYPALAQRNKEQGTVISEVIIGNDGSISHIKVKNGVSATLDAEAVRVIGNMPKFEPAMKDGKAVAVSYTLPISFRLQ